jgi:8-amino-7-oxononanoate synthase
MGYEICSPASPILAVRLKDEATAVWVWNRLLENGIYVNLALPLRCSLSAAHTDEQIEEIRGHFAAIMDDLPLRTEGVAVARA